MAPLQKGQPFALPVGGGSRQPLPQFAGLNIYDMNTSWDGSRLSTVRGDAFWMNFSPDGQWIAFLSPNADQTCGHRSITNNTLLDTWVVRRDGTDAHVVAPAALPNEWSADSRSVVVEPQVARPDAPLGGVVRAYVDGSPPDLIYAYTAGDRTADLCHTYGVWSRMYHGSSKTTR